MADSDLPWSRKAEHDELRRQMRDFADLLVQPHAIAQSAMLRARVDFARVFASHVANERLHLQGLVRIRPGHAAIAAAFEQRMAELQKDYSTHVNRWTPVEIARDWRDYGRAVKLLQGRLRTHLSWEEAHLPRAP